MQVKFFVNRASSCSQTISFNLVKWLYIIQGLLVLLKKAPIAEEFRLESHSGRGCQAKYSENFFLHWFVREILACVTENLRMFLGRQIRPLSYSGFSVWNKNTWRTLEGFGLICPPQQKVCFMFSKKCQRQAFWQPIEWPGQSGNHKTQSWLVAVITGCAQSMPGHAVSSPAGARRWIFWKPPFLAN